MDFVITLNHKVHWLIEVKTSDGDIGNGLRYYREKLQPRESLQLVLNLLANLDSPVSRLTATKYSHLPDAGSSAASSAARPGAEIGPGGSPSYL